MRLVIIEQLDADRVQVARVANSPVLTDIFGEGRSAAEAIDDLRATLHDMLEKLAEEEFDLQPHLVEQLAELRAVLLASSESAGDRHFVDGKRRLIGDSKPPAQFQMNWSF